MSVRLFLLSALAICLISFSAIGGDTTAVDSVAYYREKVENYKKYCYRRVRLADQFSFSFFYYINGKPVVIEKYKNEIDASMAIRSDAADIFKKARTRELIADVSLNTGLSLLGLGALFFLWNTFSI